MARSASTDITSEIRLRDVTESDIPIFFDHQLDPDANRMVGFTPRDWQTFTAHWHKIMADATIIKKTILCNGQVAGNIGSFERFGQREVSYWLGREYWGKGIATTALSEFLHYVQVRPLYARVAKHHLASLRVLQKCGFIISGEDRWVSSAASEEIEEFILTLAAESTAAAQSVRE